MLLKTFFQTREKEGGGITGENLNLVLERVVITTTEIHGE